MKKIMALLTALVIVCTANAQAPSVPAEKGATFGQVTTADDAVTVEQMVNKIKINEKQNKTQQVKLKGTVTSVCEEMGCWLKIKSADSDIMVKMSGHSFFVPLAISGKEIVIEGTAEEKITSVNDLRHFAKDAGKTNDEIAAITEPKKEIVIEAKGILVL